MDYVPTPLGMQLMFVSDEGGHNSSEKDREWENSSFCMQDIENMQYVQTAKNCN